MEEKIPRGECKDAWRRGAAGEGAGDRQSVSNRRQEQVRSRARQPGRSLMF